MMTNTQYQKLKTPITVAVARAKAEALAMPNTFVKALPGYYLYCHNGQIYELEKKVWGWGWCKLGNYPDDSFPTLKVCKSALIDWLKD